MEKNAVKNKNVTRKTRTTKYMFYDFEATQNTGTHVVNWVDCQDFEGNIFNFETVEEFCKFTISEEHKGYTFIAHNAKAYDSQFILKYCVENQIKPCCIYAGSKIMSMSIEKYKIRFIDSINFINSSLASFPKKFGLTELKKGNLPHYFNRECNKNYVGTMPSKKHYGYDSMSTDRRTAFLKWYDDHVNEKYVFNVKNKLRSYCRGDVGILRRSMLKFREDFIKLENIAPLQYVTIALFVWQFIVQIICLNT